MIFRDDMTAAGCSALIANARRYRCCRHCADDQPHIDVDTHDLPCNAPDPVTCVAGRSHPGQPPADTSGTPA